MIARCLVVFALIFQHRDTRSGADAVAREADQRHRSAPDDRARQWLVLVDDKNYAQSWTEDPARTFKTKQKADAWADRCRQPSYALGRGGEPRPQIHRCEPQQHRGHPL